MADAEPNLLRETRRTVGRVDAVEPNLITIATPGGQTQQITITSDTVIVKGALGTSQDLREGARIVVKYEPGAQQHVVEVVVLPAESLHGLPIVAVTPDSLTIRNLSGELVTVSTSGARIDTTTVGTASEITLGSTVFVRAKLGDAGKLAADDVIVLPDGTAFGV
jgi:hypothetical protein